MNPDVKVDVSNLPELPEGEWEIVLNVIGNPDDYVLRQNRWVRLGDLATTLGDSPLLLIARPVLKPLPCRCGTAASPRREYIPSCWQIRCVVCGRRGPWKKTIREADIGWNEMQADNQ